MHRPFDVLKTSSHNMSSEKLNVLPVDKWNLLKLPRDFLQIHMGNVN